MDTRGGEAPDEARRGVRPVPPGAVQRAAAPGAARRQVDPRGCATTTTAVRRGRPRGLDDGPGPAAAMEEAAAGVAEQRHPLHGAGVQLCRRLWFPPLWIGGGGNVAAWLAGARLGFPPLLGLLLPQGFCLGLKKKRRKIFVITNLLLFFLDFYGLNFLWWKWGWCELWYTQLRWEFLAFYGRVCSMCSCIREGGEFCKFESFEFLTISCLCSKFKRR